MVEHDGGIAVGPAEDELAGGVDRHARVEVRARVVACDDDFVADRCPGRVEPLGVHIRTHGRLIEAGPGDDKGTIRRHRHIGDALIVVRVCVDEELSADGGAGGVEALAVDVHRAVRLLAHPDDDEVARVVDGEAGRFLQAVGGGVDLEDRGEQGAVRRHQGCEDVVIVGEVVDQIGPGERR